MEISETLISSVVSSILFFCAGLGACLLKSRCTTIKCLGCKIERNVLDGDRVLQSLENAHV